MAKEKVWIVSAAPRPKILSELFSANTLATSLLARHNAFGRRHKCHTKTAKVPWYFVFAYVNP